MWLIVLSTAGVYIPPVSHVLLSSSQCLHNTDLMYKVLIAFGQIVCYLSTSSYRNAVTSFGQ